MERLYQDLGRPRFEVDDSKPRRMAAVLHPARFDSVYQEDRLEQVLSFMLPMFRFWIVARKGAPGSTTNAYSCCENAVDRNLGC
ncbi:unnamed protein product [Soboliphyme baturini]|uniref:Transposase n=1 Tax=Soboliphyme baturini TaxID=241478 RepID=A0A183IDU2_9BILA|nr:unnamed protein product [Soboliphyme baturini]